MKATVYQKLLRHLALASISLGSGAGVASAALAEIPEGVAADLIDELDGLDELDERPAGRSRGASTEALPSASRDPAEAPTAVSSGGKARWAVTDRIGALRLLAHDPRAFVRARVARSARTLWDEAPDDALALVRQLASDPDPVVFRAATATLGDLIERATPARRIEIVCDFTVSPEAAHRVAIGSALTRPIPAFVTDLAIAELARDPSAEVRALALLAAERHFAEAPGTYRDLALAATTDADASVRAAAHRVLRSPSNAAS